MPWFTVSAIRTNERRYRVWARTAKAARALVDNNPEEPEDASGEAIDYEDDDAEYEITGVEKEEA